MKIADSLCDGCYLKVGDTCYAATGQRPRLVRDDLKAMLCREGTALFKERYVNLRAVGHLFKRLGIERDKRWDAEPRPTIHGP